MYLFLFYMKIRIENIENILQFNVFHLTWRIDSLLCEVKILKILNIGNIVFSIQRGESILFYINGVRNWTLIYSHMTVSKTHLGKKKFPSICLDSIFEWNEQHKQTSRFFLSNILHLNYIFVTMKLKIERKMKYLLNVVFTNGFLSWPIDIVWFEQTNNIYSIFLYTFWHEKG